MCTWRGLVFLVCLVAYGYGFFTGTFTGSNSCSKTYLLPTFDLLSGFPENPVLTYFLTDFKSFGVWGFLAGSPIHNAIGDITVVAKMISRTKNQPKEEVLGTDIPQTSGGHSRGCPGRKLRSGRSKSWEASFWARMSMT